jgi:hypothetical protein
VPRAWLHGLWKAGLRAVTAGCLGLCRFGLGSGLGTTPSPEVGGYEHGCMSLRTPWDQRLLRVLLVLDPVDHSNRGAPLSFDSSSKIRTRILQSVSSLLALVRCSLLVHRGWWAAQLSLPPSGASAAEFNQFLQLVRVDRAKVCSSEGGVG